MTPLLGPLSSVLCFWGPKVGSKKWPKNGDRKMTFFRIFLRPQAKNFELAVRSFPSATPPLCPFAFVTTTLRHCATTSLRHYVTMSLRHYVTTSLRHYVTSSRKNLALYGEEPCIVWIGASHCMGRNLALYGEDPNPTSFTPTACKNGNTREIDSGTNHGNKSLEKSDQC